MADGKITIDSALDQKGINKGLKDMKKTLDGTANKLKGTGKKMSAGLTAPILGLGTVAFAAANEMDQAYSAIRAGTGATGEDLEALKENFKNVFTNVPESADEVSNALADLNTRTGQTGKPLEDLTTQFLDLGRVAGEEVPGLIASGTRAFGDWGIAVEDQAGTMDYFWKVSQTTGIGVTDLMNKMVQFGAPLRQMGFDFETSAALLGKFEKEGVNAELVMGSMRQALGKMAKDGIDAEEGLQKTIEAVKNAGSTSEANAAAIELFGARAGPDMAAAIREGRFEVEDLLETLGSSKETIGAAAEDTQTLGDQFGILKNQTMEALEPLGQIFLDLAKEYLPPLIEAVKSVGEWFTNLSPTVQKVILIVMGLVAAIGPLLIFVGMAISGFMALLPVFSAIGAAILFLVSPIGMIIAAVVALVAIVIFNWETVKELTITVFTAIGEFFVATWEWIKEIFNTSLEWVKETWSTSWTWIKETATTVFSAIAEFFVTIWEGIKNTFNTVIEAIVSFVKQRWENLKTNTTNAFNAVKDLITNIWNGIKSFFTTIVSALVDFVKNRWNNLKNNVSTVFNAIKSVITTIWNTIKSVTSGVWNGIKSTLGGIWNGIKSKVSSVFNGIKNIISDVWNGIKSTTDKIWTGITDSIKGAINGVIAAINGMLNALSSISITTPKIPDWVPKFGGKTMDIGFPSIPNIPSLDVGTNFVAQDGLAMIHKGEAVVPAEHNGPYKPGGKSIKIEPSDVIIDGHRVGKVIWKPVKENMDRDMRIKESFRRG
ncbi:phage tail tape measure protein [Oceanobacillus sp. CF4.6]|uniref:phage tail tape measure protein n=1 Tax=Oceanobacillus sp. CF4.6 TaxID=3373080 RepID=UPI003EE801B7